MLCNPSGHVVEECDVVAEPMWRHALLPPSVRVPSLGWNPLRSRVGRLWLVIALIGAPRERSPPSA